MSTVIIEHLYAETFGSHIGKYSKRLKVTQGGTVLAQAPLLHLQSVIINSRGVSISADAIEACCERGIPIMFLTERGNPYASLHAAGLTGTVITRREQILAYYDPRGTHIALTIAAAKVRNQEATLKYLAKNRKDNAPKIHAALQDCAINLRDSLAALDRLAGQSKDQSVDQCRASIMGIEGNAARIYWEGVGLVLPEHYDWQGRAGRGAADPINSLLNYGYGILYSKIEQAVILAGLDPYAGYLHTDRAGKPSLVLDMIEEFRQRVIDRLVIGLATRSYHVEQEPDGRLTDAVRKDFAEKVLAHLESTTRYQKKRYPLRFIIQNQARNLAAYLRGKTNTYDPFVSTW